MARLIRLYRSESLWFAGLVLAAGIFFGTTTEARRFNCFYHFEADKCFDWFILDCVCVE